MASFGTGFPPKRPSFPRKRESSPPAVPHKRLLSFSLGVADPLGRKKVAEACLPQAGTMPDEGSPRRTGAGHFHGKAVKVICRQAWGSGRNIGGQQHVV